MEISKRDRAGRGILVATILASGLGFLMNSAVTIALPSIQTSLGVGLEAVQWIVNAYALALGALILLSGSIGDLIGVGRVFATGILLFGLGSAACALSPSVGVLIASRALQGSGAALMVPGSLAIINTTFKDKERGSVIGLWAGISGAIAALGPFVGGFLAGISWRLVFGAMVPLAAGALFVTLRMVPMARGSRKVSPDLPGAVLVLFALGGLSLTLIRAPRHGLGVVETVALLVALVAGAAFVLHEARAAKPLVPKGMFNKHMVGANIATVLLYFSFQGLLFLLSYSLQQQRGFSPTVAGMALLPTTALIAIFSGPSGVITDRLGPRLQMIIGPAGVAVAATVIALGVSVEGYAAGVLPGVVLMGLSMVAVIPAVTRSALDVEGRFSGSASGLNNAAARIAGLLAVAAVGSILGALFASYFSQGLETLDLVPELRETLLGRSSELMAMDLPTGLSAAQSRAVRETMRLAYTGALRPAFLLCAITAGLAALVSALLVRNRGARRS